MSEPGQSYVVMEGNTVEEVEVREVIAYCHRRQAGRSQGSNGNGGVEGLQLRRQATRQALGSCRRRVGRHAFGVQV